MMKRYIALTLAALMLAMTACSSADTEESAADVNAPAENAEEVMSEESAEEAEEEKKNERPEDVEVIDYKTLKPEKDPVYDRASDLFVLYFTDHEIVYPADASCSIGLISDEEAVSVTGTPDMNAYPDMFVTDEDYCGIAIKVSEDIPAGDYLVSITFDRYIVSFDHTIQ